MHISTATTPAIVDFLSVDTPEGYDWETLNKVRYLLEFEVHRRGTWAAWTGSSSVYRSIGRGRVRLLLDR
jgi:hypothetical protein